MVFTGTFTVIMIAVCFNLMVKSNILRIISEFCLSRMLDYFGLNVVERAFDLYHGRIMYKVVNLKINVK